MPKLLFTELTAWVLAVETKLFYPFFYPHSEFLKRTLCDPATEPIFPWFLEIVTNDDLVDFHVYVVIGLEKHLGPTWYLVKGARALPAGI